MSEQRVIKRYANRKLYDTERSRYITLQDVAELVRDGVDIQIVDNDNDEDITGLTLAQILLDSEKRKQRTLPLHALKHMLQSGGSFLPQRIAQPVSQIRGDAERAVTEIRDQAERQLKTLRERANLEEVRGSLQELLAQTQASVEEFQHRVEGTLKTLTPGAAGEGGDDEDGEPGLLDGPATASAPRSLDDRLAALEARVAALEARSGHADDGDRP